jgi:hypothetical protein
VLIIHDSRIKGVDDAAAEQTSKRDRSHNLAKITLALAVHTQKARPNQCVTHLRYVGRPNSDINIGRPSAI